ASETFKDERLQPGRKLLRFREPVKNQTGGADDQGGQKGRTTRVGGMLRPRTGALRDSRLEQGECLECFAQSHFIGEDSAEIIFAQKMEPGDASLLIGA